MPREGPLQPANNNEKLDKSHVLNELSHFKDEITRTGAGDVEIGFLTRLIDEVFHNRKTPVDAMFEARTYMGQRQHGSSV